MNVKKDTKNLQKILDENRAHKNGNNAIKEFHKMHEYIIKLEAKVENLALSGVGCSLPTEKEITIEAERRHPYKKHFVDYNNGMHEGFIDGAYFVLETIKKTK